MVFKPLCMAGGIFGAAAFSQFPEYSQQYTQRLAGAVDELGAVVEMFDADADGLNMTRQEALVDLSQGGRMAKARALSMRRVFDRHDKLSNDFSVIRGDTRVISTLNIWRMTDTELMRKVWQDFKPALPVTADGIGFGVAGFLAGLGVTGGLLAFLRRFGRRRRAAA